MDDPPDRGYSRAPELRDLAALCRSLNRENVRYLLIGGRRGEEGEETGAEEPLLAGSVKLGA
jgi:hypothetical protein